MIIICLFVGCLGFDDRSRLSIVDCLICMSVERKMKKTKINVLWFIWIMDHNKVPIQSWARVDAAQNQHLIYDCKNWIQIYRKREREGNEKKK